MLSIPDSCRYQSITCTVAVLLHVNPICFCDSLSNRISSLRFLLTSCRVHKTCYVGNNVIKSIPLSPIFVMYFCLENNKKPPKQIKWVRWDCRSAEAARQWGSPAGRRHGVALCASSGTSQLLAFTCYLDENLQSCASLHYLPGPWDKCKSLYFNISLE